MDARVTKQRLGNMLSYDWLKILCAIAAAVVGLVVFFTMVGIRPARAQQFIVHFYGDYDYGSDMATFSDVLDGKLSYDVLRTRADRFGSGMMEGASYTARRSSGEGSVAIAADYTASEDTVTPFAQLVELGMRYEGTVAEEQNSFYCLDEYFADLEKYLVRFFGEDWQRGEIDRAEAEKCFRARNVDGPNNKNRYRSEAQIAAGIEDEVERLTSLCDAYKELLKRGLGGEQLPFTAYTSEIKRDETVVETRSYLVGISLKNFIGLDSLVSYEGANGNASHEKMNFLIYNNGTNDGMDDLKYEAVLCLKYLVDRYYP